MEVRVQRINDRRPIRVDVEQLPQSEKQWVDLYHLHPDGRVRHRLYPATEFAIRRLHRALRVNPEPRTSIRSMADECGVATATMARVLDALAKLGAMRMSDNSELRLTAIWPPKVD
jgi:hypothetical protein